MNYQQTGLEIFQKVGGAENVVSLTHCATRLRFRLNDFKKADKDGIQKIEGVLGCVTANGELQVIIGPNVTQAYQAIQKVFDGDGAKAPKEKGKLIDRFLGIISGIFSPIIPAITAAGMVKALLAILKVSGVIDVDGQAYQIMSFASDAAFYFMPILLANSAAKIFDMSSGLAMMLAGILVHPTFVSMVDAGNAINLFGLPIRAVKYSSTVIPIILIVLVASYVERMANKYLPEVIKYIARPLIVMVIMIPLALCVLGPIGYVVGDGLALLLSAINGITPWLLPTVMGTFTPILVMFGLHNGLIPLASAQFATIGHENIMGPGMLASNISQGAASLAVAVRSKDKQMRQMAVSTGFTALMGITEPAMYGVTLKYKRLLPCVMLGGFAGGLYAGISGLVRYSFGSAGLATLPVFIGEPANNIIKALITVVIGFLVTFISAMFVKLEDDVKDTADGKTEQQDIVISSPLKGKVIPLEKVNDPVFAGKIMGDGMAVIPEEGVLYAPMDGTLMIYDTMHAVGITGENGLEVLMHIGMDTVKLNGTYFHKIAESDTMIKKGDPIVSFDIEKIKERGYDLTTPVIVTNLNGKQVSGTAAEKIMAGDSLFAVI